MGGAWSARPGDLRFALVRRGVRCFLRCCLPRSSSTYVVFGGSWATDRALLRRSFRNWYQPRYPHVFSSFRTVGSLSRGPLTPPIYST